MKDGPDDDVADAAHLLERARAIRFDDLEQELAERRGRTRHTSALAQLIKGGWPAISDWTLRSSESRSSIDVFAARSVETLPNPDGLMLRFSGQAGAIDVQVPLSLVPGVVKSLEQLLRRP